MSNRPVTEAHAGRMLLMANITYWMAAGAYSPFLSAYLTAKGMTAAQIGLLLTLQPAATILIQPLWARLSDRSGNRRLVLLLLTLGAAASSLLYERAGGFWSYFAATLAFTAFFSALLPLCDAIVIQGAAQYHRDFARIRMGGTLGYALVVFLIGFYLDKTPTAQFTLVCAACLILAFFEAMLPPVRQAEEEAPQGGERGAERRVFASREVVFVLAFAFICQIGIGFSGSFLGRYVVELGYRQGLIGVLNCVSALSEVPILLVASRITRRFGEIPILIFSGGMTGLRILLTGLGTVPAMVAAQLLQSVTYMTVYFCCATYISRNVLPGRQSQGKSVLAVVQTGFASVVANLGGGLAGDILGIRQAYLLVALLTAAGTAAVTLVYYRRRAAGDRG